MSAREIAVAVLLAIAAASAFLSAAGVLLARGVYARLHYLAPVSTVGVAAVAAAVLVRESFSQAGIKAALAGAIVFFMNPVLTHATARAARIREHGAWKPAPEEHIPIAGERVEP